MNILLTNDDGYFAPGLRTLAKVLSLKHSVVIIAPEEESSGAGHSINFFRALKYRCVDMDDGIETYAVNGTPTDCVKFGLDVILKGRDIDLVISGINNILNLGTDLFYSGTVNAAIEATILYKKAIAVSSHVRKGECYDYPALFILNNLEKLASYASDSVTISVNIPYNEPDKIKGVVAAPIGLRRYADRYELIGDGNYILTGTPVCYESTDEKTDVAYADCGYITITPLTLYPTDMKTLKLMEGEEFKA